MYIKSILKTTVIDAIFYLMSLDDEVINLLQRLHHKLTTTIRVSAIWTSLSYGSLRVYAVVVLSCFVDGAGQPKLLNRSTSRDLHGWKRDGELQKFNLDGTIWSYIIIVPVGFKWKLICVR